MLMLKVISRHCLYQADIAYNTTRWYGAERASWGRWVCDASTPLDAATHVTTALTSALVSLLPWQRTSY